MDDLDSAILGLLRENGRRSFSDLGRAVGLSTNATAARVRRMEAAGIILGYTVRTDTRASAVRSGLEVFIDVRLSEAMDYDTFTGNIGRLQGIVEAVHMTGGYDYLLHAFVADTRALDRLLRQRKGDCGAAQTQTRVALRQPCRTSWTA